MSAHDAILARVRRSLGVGGADPVRRAAVGERLARSPRGVVPARGRVPPEDRVKLFTRMAKLAHAAVEERTIDEVPTAIADFLARHGLPAAVRMGADPRLAAIRWTGPPLEVRLGQPAADDLATVSHAEVGIAETGTLVLVSGPQNPTLLSFLSNAHIILIEADRIVGDAETAIAAVRSTLGEGSTPRTINFITGPSRSGDIEQTMQLGAHGPRSLLTLIIRATSSPREHTTVG